MTDTSILDSRNLADRSMRIDSLLLENFKGFNPMLKNCISTPGLEKW
ncbi:MAG: hypothetical protein RLZZ117_2811 [Cyanobacteriota bacterium]|jgi:uncharacterized protein (DUF2344 family)